MDKLQMEHPAPLRKPGLSAHFLGFSPSSIDYSHRSGAVQYDALHRSLWDHKIGPHDRIGGEASWLHSSWEQQSDSSGIDTSLKSGVDDAATAALCRSWDSWDDSAILQHKRRAAEEKRQQQQQQQAGGGGAAALGMQDCGSLLSDDRSAGGEKTGGFLPTVAVSGSRSIPFACKLDVGFATLSARAGFNDEEEGYNSGNKPVSAGGFLVKNEVVVNPKSVKVDSLGLEASGPLQADVEDGRSHHCLVDMAGRGKEPRTDELMVKRERELEGGTVASMGDATIGLKLGKRTYFEDGAAGAGSRAASSSPNSGNNNNSNSTHITTTSSNKKQKAPRCQAEGCRSDLSSAKEYHRRHKVCPPHSKAGKVRVGNLEQRFCQQCSRFHVLTEFDEGKRSCRRRLAGHNERRRKPQPLAMSLLSSGSFPYQSGDKHLLNSALLEHPYFLQQQQHHHQQHHQHQHQHQHQRAPFSSSSLDHAALACQLRFPGAETQVLKLLRIPKEEPATSYPSLELQHFLHGSGTLIGGHGLALSNPPGAMNLGSEDLSSVSQPPSGISVSGRALSLLSSSLVSQENPISMSLGVSHHPSLSIEQLLAENQAASSHQIVSGTSTGQPCFTPQSITNSNGSVTGSPDIMDKEPREPPAMSDFDGRSMFIMLQDNNFQGLHGGDSQHGRPILDLMQISSPQSQGSRPTSLQQPIEVQYTELDGLRSYESMFGRQNIM